MTGNSIKDANPCVSFRVHWRK